MRNVRRSKLGPKDTLFGRSRGRKRKKEITRFTSKMSTLSTTKSPRHDNSSNEGSGFWFGSRPTHPKRSINTLCGKRSRILTNTSSRFCRIVDGLRKIWRSPHHRRSAVIATERMSAPRWTSGTIIDICWNTFPPRLDTSTYVRHARQYSDELICSHVTGNFVRFTVKVENIPNVSKRPTKKICLSGITLSLRMKLNWRFDRQATINAWTRGDPESAENWSIQRKYHVLVVGRCVGWRTGRKVFRLTDLGGPYYWSSEHPTWRACSPNICRETYWNSLWSKNAWHVSTHLPDDHPPYANDSPSALLNLFMAIFKQVDPACKMNLVICDS